ncbi:MAG: sugar phosphate isomerase/epimerase family protein [Armatimonadota bacterium]
MRKIAVQLYSLRERAEKDYFGVLKDVADMGYAGVETAGLYGNTPADVKKVVDDLGLAVCSAHAGLPTAENINEIEDTAKTLGYQYIISGFGPDDFKTMDGIKAAAEKFQAGAELAKERGLRVGYHNHYWEFDLVDGRYGYSRFFEMAPSVFSQLDTYWASNFNVVDVPLVVSVYQDNLPLLHIKDGPLVKGEPHTAVGQGKMNFPEILAAANDTTEWLVVELDACATDMTQAVRESYQYLAGNKMGQGRK